MKLLLDANLSPRLAELLNKQGIESVHVREHGLQHADDETIFDFAAEDDHMFVEAASVTGPPLADLEVERD